MTTKRTEVPGCADILLSEDGGYYIRYRAAGNRRILAHSEVLSSKANVTKNIESMTHVFGGTLPMIRWIDE